MFTNLLQQLLLHNLLLLHLNEKRVNFGDKSEEITKEKLTCSQEENNLFAKNLT